MSGLSNQSDRSDHPLSDILDRVIQHTLANRVSTVTSTLATAPSRASGSTQPPFSQSGNFRRDETLNSSSQFQAGSGPIPTLLPIFNEEVFRRALAMAEQHLATLRSRSASPAPNLIYNHSGDIVVASSFDDTSALSGWATVTTNLIPEHRLTGSFARAVPHDHLLLLATPILPSDRHRPISISEILNRHKVVSFSVQFKSFNVYGGCVARYLEWCDSELVVPCFRFPVDWSTARRYFDHLAVVACLRESTIRHYASALCFWSLAHGLEWDADKFGLDIIYKAAKNISPLGKAPRLPFELLDLRCLRKFLDVSVPENLAVLVCASTAFFGMARVGELIVKSLSASNSSHPAITPSMVLVHPPNSVLRVRPRIELHLPFDKVQHHQGDFITIVPQSGEGPCPFALLSQHLQTKPPASQPLFSYRSNSGHWVPLSRSRFLSRVNQTLKAADRPAVLGHSFRIGGATHYLLEGVPPETVKVAGRWKSDSFERYCRQVNVIVTRAMSGVGSQVPPRDAVSVQGYDQSEEFGTAFDELASADDEM